MATYLAMREMIASEESFSTAMWREFLPLLSSTDQSEG